MAENTVKHRRARRRYGTKSFAIRALIRALRAWAKALRAQACIQGWDTDARINRNMAELREREQFGQVLGVMLALRGTGASSHSIEEYFERRFRQINRTGHIKRGRASAELRVIR